MFQLVWRHCTILLLIVRPSLQRQRGHPLFAPLLGFPHSHEWLLCISLRNNTEIFTRTRYVICLARVFDIYFHGGIISRKNKTRQKTYYYDRDKGTKRSLARATLWATAPRRPKSDPPLSRSFGQCHSGACSPLTCVSIAAVTSLSRWSSVGATFFVLESSAVVVAFATRQCRRWLLL